MDPVREPKYHHKAVAFIISYALEILIVKISGE